MTKRGVEAAVLVPIGQWRRLLATTKPSPKDVLLVPEARTERLVPDRVGHRHRQPPILGLCACLIPPSFPN
ncbi:MAG: hypothetical protein ACFB6S_10300 [Geminicoccaceae bacterium]